MSDPDALGRLLPAVVEQARGFISDERNRFEDEINPKLRAYLDIS